MLMIARRQPMANDLRHIMTVLRIADDLERIGDLGKNIAKRALAVSGENHPKPLMTGLKHMVELALNQLKDVLDAYAERDADKARGRVAPRRAHRRHVQFALPRAADLHDGGPAQHRPVHAPAVCAPRTSSGSATTPPTSPRTSTTWCTAWRSPTTGRRATTPPRLLIRKE